MKTRLSILALLLWLPLFGQYSQVIRIPLDGEQAEIAVSKRDSNQPAWTVKLGETKVGLPGFEVSYDRNGKPLDIWLASDKTQISQGGILLGEGPPIKDPPPRPNFQGHRLKPTAQRLAPINFQDDFARAGDETTQKLWTTLSGRFELNMSLNPGSSQGAFQLWAATDPGAEALAIATTSAWFWRDFRFGASVLTKDAQAVALVFAFQDKDNFSRIEYSGQETRLIKREKGKDNVIASQKVTLQNQVEAWTRLEVIISNGTLIATKAGIETLRCETKHVFNGQVGLYLKNSSQAFFDDVTVKTTTPNDLLDTRINPFGPSEQTWSDFSGKNFLTDRFMVNWAHPRSFWNQRGDDFHWFRSRLFNDLDLTWKRIGKQGPRKQLAIRAFVDDDAPNSGVTIAVKDQKASLNVNGKPIAEAPAPPEINSLNLTITHSRKLTFQLNDKQLFQAEIPEDCQLKGDLAVDLGGASGLEDLAGPDWRDSTTVRSSHRLDYSFEHAPTAWFPQIGSWKSTHRWACVPKWSFFAGRGIPGPTDVNHGNAVLWNLRKISGDFDLEIFAAPLEGTAQRAHFTFPTSLNVAFAANGTDLVSGYNFVNGMYDIPSQLLLKDKLLASNDDRVDTDLRRREVPLYHRVTQVWQHFRIQRRNGKILVHSAAHDDRGKYIPLKTVFDIKDETSPESPSQFALWTWGDNGIAIARATLSFQKDCGPATPPHVFQPPKQTRKNAKTAVNQISGGQFSTVIHDAPFDLDTLNTLQLDVKPGSNTCLALLLNINGQVAEIPLNNPIRQKDFTFLLDNKLPPQGKDGWLEINVNLEQAARPFFEPNEKLIVSQIAIASPYETIAEIAGMGINPPGATVEYTQPKLTKQKTNNKPTEATTATSLKNDFSQTLGTVTRLGGPDGAALLRVPKSLQDGNRVLRLLNQNIGGIAGAILCDIPFSLKTIPKIAFDYKIPQGIEINLIIVTDLKNLEITLTGVDNTWTVAGKADIIRDNQWHHVQIDLAKLLAPHIKEDTIIRKIALADTWRMSSYQRIAFYIDNLEFIPSDANLKTFPSLPKKSVPQREAPMPPLVSYIPSDRLVRATLETNLPYETPEIFNGFEIRREAWALRNTDTAATGHASAELVNLEQNGFCSIYFRKAPWDVNRWPCFAFNYKFKQPKCALNLSLLVNETLTVVEWTGKNVPGSHFTPGVVGQAVPFAIQDGQWHETYVDLRKMLQDTRFKNGFPPTGLNAAELSLWATNHSSGGYKNPEDARVYFDNFTIFSNRGKDPAFDWSAHPDDKGYAVAFDQSPTTIPSEKITHTTPFAQFKNTQPGSWFFHVRTQDKNGKWSETTHRNIVIEP